MQKPVKDVRFQFWNKFLTQLELALDTAREGGMTFVLEKGQIDGIELYDFQRSAINKLADLGAFESIKELENPLQSRVGKDFPLTPIGYTIVFNSDFLRKTLRWMKRANEMGAISSRPLFQLDLDKATLIVTDLTDGQSYAIHKLQHQSQADMLLRYVFENEVFKLTKDDLENANVTVDYKLGKVLRDLKLHSLLSSAFMPVMDSERVELRPIVTAEDLKLVRITESDLRSHIQETYRKREK